MTVSNAHRLTHDAPNGNCIPPQRQQFLCSPRHSAKASKKLGFFHFRSATVGPIVFRSTTIDARQKQVLPDVIHHSRNSHSFSTAVFLLFQGAHLEHTRNKALFPAAQRCLVRSTFGRRQSITVYSGTHCLTPNILTETSIFNLRQKFLRLPRCSSRSYQ